MSDTDSPSCLGPRARLAAGFAFGACTSFLSMYAAVLYTSYINNMEVTVAVLNATLWNISRVQYGIALVALVIAIVLFIRDMPWSVTGFIRGDGGGL